MIAVPGNHQITKILALGAHPDDIEIGCGGAILDAISRNPKLQFHWEVFSGNPTRKIEATSSAQAILGSTQSSIHINDFQDSYFPDEWSQIKKRFGAIATTFQPDLILTHHLEDRHQDHRVLAELTWNTFRNHLILEYEIPKYEGDLLPKNCYIGFNKSIAKKKTDLLITHFGSQREKKWFDVEVFQGLMRVRGIESTDCTDYAEAFYCRKFSLKI
ncbi:PIG-L family deacetylase [Pirellulaceae bacterium]|nr:PIG-L family deacetylase [Pirellulaceae bacterium]MDB4412956.1 PIG-L family deacetylase [Pirellulaceae bacterium]MDB4640178.1 PIG-L family deacetylase [Pirellulaceae bacterium]